VEAAGFSFRKKARNVKLSRCDCR